MTETCVTARNTFISNFYNDADALPSYSSSEITTVRTEYQETRQLHAMQRDDDRCNLRRGVRCDVCMCMCVGK